MSGSGARMRVLHTADLHLGRSFHGVDMLCHQADYLDHLVDLVRGEQIDVVLLAGDIYDRAVPPLEAVELLSDLLLRLTEHAQVIAISGNHDSATRLGFGARLMTDRVRLCTRISEVGSGIEVADGAGIVYPIPYLDPDAARHSLMSEPGQPLARSHEAVMAEATRRIGADLNRRGAGGRPPASIALTHAFIAGGAACESERDIRVGGLDTVPAGLFGSIGYVAAGHLHGPQRVGPGDGPSIIRYAGSPLAYSFSEMNQHKSSVVASAQWSDAAGWRWDTELVPAPVPRQLGAATGTLEELLGRGTDDLVDHWLQLTVTDAARPPDLYPRLRAKFPHLLVLRHRPETVTEAREAMVTPAADPLQVACDFVDYVTGGEPSSAERQVLAGAIERAQVES